MTAGTEPVRTEDGRWLVIGGRRWRAIDPGIPEALRRELVDELQSARRAVGSASRADDPEATRRARSRVQQAKVALGERGEPWWQPTEAGRRTRLRATMLALAEHRGPDRTICPSDASRSIGGEHWQSLSPVARAVARELATEGALIAEQRDNALDPAAPWKGPIRLRRVAVPPSV